MYSGVDRCGAEASGLGNACGRYYSVNRDLRTDVLPLEETVRWVAVGPGPGIQAATGGECPIKEAGGRAQSG